jgi:hypothetical protein
LGSIFGYNYSFTDATHFYRKDIDGNPRTYKNFNQMAEEIALSNLYGGINYRFSLEAGLKQGSRSRPISEQSIKLYPPELFYSKF